MKSGVRFDATRGDGYSGGVNSSREYLFSLLGSALALALLLRLAR
jgi:hypothetical protein